MINQHRFLAVLALTLSTQLALVISSTTASSSAARAATVSVNGDVGMSASTYSVSKFAASVTLSAERRGGTHGALSVYYTTVGGTAAAGAQFTAETGTLTWADGDAAKKMFAIRILNVKPFTGAKWFAVRLNAGTGTILGSGTSATIHIVDSPPPATVTVNGDVGMTSSAYSVAQSVGAITLAAERRGGTKGPLSVAYNTIGGTAAAGEQFTAKTGTLTWGDGDAADKTFTIPVSNARPFTGTKWFAVRLTARTGTILGSHTSATVHIVGSTTAVTKSIRGWVSCNEMIDESFQLEQALLSAANNAFTLVVDCPVRFHTGTASQHSISVPDGTTISFQGAGEFLVGSGIPALTVAHPSQVTFLDWNLTFL